jgi:hypothetical protein
MLFTGSTADPLRAWPYAYDPAVSNTVAATWMDGTGVASGANISTDTRNQGLLLPKTSAASNQAQAGVVIREVEGMSLTELGFDMRSGGQCTATSPRFVVVTSDEVVHKIGCATGTAQPAPATGWQRLRFDPANPAQTTPAVSPGTKAVVLSPPSPPPSSPETTRRTTGTPMVGAGAGGVTVIDCWSLPVPPPKLSIAAA